MRALIPGISAGMLGRGRARSVPNPALSFPIFPLFQGGEALFGGNSAGAGMGNQFPPLGFPGIGRAGSWIPPHRGESSTGKNPWEGEKSVENRGPPPASLWLKSMRDQLPNPGLFGTFEVGERLGFAPALLAIQRNLPGFSLE